MVRYGPLNLQPGLSPSISPSIPIDISYLHYRFGYIIFIGIIGSKIDFTSFFFTFSINKMP